MTGYLRGLAGAAMALGLMAASATLHSAFAWPFQLDGPGSTNDIVGLYPGWPYDTQGNQGCLTCHTTNDPEPGGSEELNGYGTLFKSNIYDFAAVEAFDSDGDLAVNGLELSMGFYPGDPASKPAPPTDVQASDGSESGGVLLTWIPVPGATSYQIHRIKSPSPALETMAQVGTTPGTSFTDSYALPGTLYLYKMKACNSHGCTGLSAGDTGFVTGYWIGDIPEQEEEPTLEPAELSEALAAVLAYANNYPPNGMVASDGAFGQQVKVTWNPRAGAKIYYVYRSTNKNQPPIPPPNTVIAEIPGTEFHDSTAVVGQVYWYSVMACSPKGCSNRSAIDPGWRYTATPTDEMVALSEGQRGAMPGALRDPAIAVVPGRRAAGDALPAVRERQPAIDVAPAVRVTPIERAAPVERQGIERESIEIERAAPERSTR